MKKTSQSVKDLVNTVSKKVSKSKKITIGGVIAIFVLLGAWYYYSNKTTSTSTETYSIGVVRKGSIATTISGSGQIIPVNTLDLKTKTAGTISTVLVKAGDKVKQGQPLVKLNATQALQKLNTAEVNLEAAKLDLQKLLKPAETIDILQLKNAIAKAEADIKNQDTLVANAYKNLLNASIEAVPGTVNSNDVAPTISGSYLGTTEGSINVVLYGSGDGTVFAMDGLATGNGYVNSVTPQPLGNTGLYIKFAPNTTQTRWTISIPNKKASNYLSLSTAYQNALDTKERTVADLNRSIEEYKVRLTKLQNGADTLDIEAKKLTIRQRENDLAQAQSDYADSIITAPFDGVISTLSADIGTNVTTGVSLGSIITDKKVAKISLNEVDVAKLTIGMPATLSFDALDGVTASSSVVEIDTVGTVTQGVVTYDVKLLFALNDEMVKPGMTVSADIDTGKKENILVVQNSAIQKDKTGQYLEVLVTPVSEMGSSTRNMIVKPAVKNTYIKTGISNEKVTEVVSGAAQGDQVMITRKSSAKTVTQTPSAQQVLSGGGSGRQRGF